MCVCRGGVLVHVVRIGRCVGVCVCVGEVCAGVCVCGEVCWCVCELHRV